MKPIAVLIGPPAAGKTRLGKSVARLMGVPFTDTDSCVVSKHGQIADIFRTEGEGRFREWEREEVSKALAGGGIVALGGGAIENSDTQSDLAAHRVVLVTVSVEAVAERIANSKRPLLDGVDSWSALVERRMPIYQRLADIEIDTSHGPMDAHATRLFDELESVR
jgi:shikimate kinase